MKLQKLRERAGFSQSSLAKVAGVSYSLIRNIEQGQKRIGGMSGERLYRLALVLNCRIEDFLDTNSLAQEVANKKNYAGLKWGLLRIEEQELLLAGASAVDGRTDNNIKSDGECIVDLSIYPFSIPGKFTCGEGEDEITIDDDAVIYSSEG